MVLFQNGAVTFLVIDRTENKWYTTERKNTYKFTEWVNVSTGCRFS